MKFNLSIFIFLITLIIGGINTAKADDKASESIRAKIERKLIEADTSEYFGIRYSEGIKRMLEDKVNAFVEFSKGLYYGPFGLTPLKAVEIYIDDLIESYLKHVNDKKRDASSKQKMAFGESGVNDKKQ